VLDTARGRPAAGVAVRLESSAGNEIASAGTDADGRCRELGPEQLAAGIYRLVFDTGGYLGEESFFPEVTVTFRISEGTAHHHIPLLLSPFAFSSYRGS
ncbi:MAG: hydroxyisourate hydrolase, partial [Sciscionella sp.]